MALSAVAVSACGQQSQQQTASAPLTETDRNAITSGVASLDQALLARDWSTAASMYTDDGMALAPNTPGAAGRAAVEKLFSGFPKVRSFKQRVVEIDGHGNLAYARATYETELIPPGSKAPVKDAGKVLAIWRKQPDGSWRVARAIWNSDGPPSAPAMTAPSGSSK
jgi:uncharacterized protein (TIGR02246 family)